jgi:hypothetical protein
MKNVTHGLHAAMTAQPGKVDELPLGYRPRRLPTTEETTPIAVDAIAVGVPTHEGAPPRGEQ